MITRPKPTRVTIWLSLRHHTKHGEAPPLRKVAYCIPYKRFLDSNFFRLFAPLRCPSRVGLSRHRPPLPRGDRGGPRPPSTAQGSSGGVNDAQSRREGPPDHPSSLPWDQLQQAAGRRQRAFGFPPGQSRCRGRRGRKCGSLAGLRVQSASMLSAQRAAQTRPPDGHTWSRPPTLWPVAGSGRLRRVVAAAGRSGGGWWRRRVLAAPPTPWPGFSPSTCDSAWARMA